MIYFIFAILVIPVIVNDKRVDHAWAFPKLLQEVFLDRWAERLVDLVHLLVYSSPLIIEREKVVIGLHCIRNDDGVIVIGPPRKVFGQMRLPSGHRAHLVQIVLSMKKQL